MKCAPNTIVQYESSLDWVAMVVITEFPHKDRLIVVVKSVKRFIEEAYRIGAIVMNLYNVGDGVLIPGAVGTNNCAESARLVVNHIKRQRK